MVKVSWMSLSCFELDEDRSQKMATEFKFDNFLIELCEWIYTQDSQRVEWQVKQVWLDMHWQEWQRSLSLCVLRLPPRWIRSVQGWQSF